MADPSTRLQSVIADIDASNAGDPRQDIIGGQSRPREVVYSERMSECLARLYPGCSEELHIAARAQHIRRWQIPRDTYPLGRGGYNSWRAACRRHHATLTAAIMRRHGYAEAPIAHVAKMIQKEELKRDGESQALENVVGVVFAEHYLDAFVASHKDYTDEKFAGILRKMMRKMDAIGHAAVLALNAPPHVRRLMDITLN